ncbi:MAG: hypothetical protein JRG68_04530 [Deltaproteobacteria bacterium]|nr:hypothetical protein [Deltaproteobacteria bacterium]
MKQNPLLSLIQGIMTEFANLTGLSPAGEVPRRYLWTDAFAVCNFLELYRQTCDEKYKNLALLLVDQVHNVLGRHHEDDSRTGWISGLDEQKGKMHPAKGGLRIGKKMNERSPFDRFDERLEWDRDGQYYHYLTKWMHALNRVSRVTGDTIYNTWAMELAKTAHAKFTYVPPSGGRKRMYWKMSIDLSYPLVESMGHHDPLDGFITYTQLQATAAKDSEKSVCPDLNEEITDMTDICKGKSWNTDDPLGIGGLLCDAYKVAQILINENFEQTDLLETLLDSSLPGLESYARTNPLELPADYRLAFRELGLSIGLRAVEKLQGLIEEKPDFFKKKHPLRTRIEILMRYAPLIEKIENFWLEPTSKKTDSWMEHPEINMVMLATSLAPDAYLTF